MLLTPRTTFRSRRYVDPSSLLASAPAKLTIDFEHDEPESLHSLSLPFDFAATRTGLCHGLAVWFDVAFTGSDAVVVLNTGPGQPGTHWYQCRLLLPQPIAVNANQRLAGELTMVANARYSYDLALRMRVVGSELSTVDGRPVESVASIALAEQFYSYLQPTAATH